MDEEVDLLEFISTVAPVTHVRVAQGKITNGRSAFSLSPATASEELNDVEDFESTDLPRLQKYLMRFGDFRERIKKYTRCFHGSTLATFLVNKGIVKSSEEARLLGQKLVNNRFLVHVDHDQPFQDNDQIYRFVNPDVYLLSMMLKDPLLGVSAPVVAPGSAPARRSKPFDAAAFAKPVRPATGEAILDWIVRHKALRVVNRMDGLRVCQMLLNDFFIKVASATGLEEFHADSTLYTFMRENVVASSFIDTILKEPATYQYEKRGWKTRYFILPTEQHRLFFYKHEADPIPKGVVDLRQSTIRAMDDIEGRKNALQINTADGPFNICFPSSEDRDRWLSSLQMAIREGFVNESSTADESRQTRSLRLRLMAGKDLPVSPFQNNNYYATISFGDSAAVRSQIAWRTKGGAPEWSDEFRFDELPLSVDECRVTVYNRAKLLNDIEVGSYVMKVTKLSSHVEMDEWVSLMKPGAEEPKNMTKKRGESEQATIDRKKSQDTLDPKHNAGQIHIRALLEYELILPPTSYIPFIDLLAEEMSIPAGLLLVIGKEHDQSTQPLLRLMASRAKATDFLLLLVSKELEGSVEQNVIFRINTIATKAIVEYLKLFGLGYLRSLLKPTVRRLVKAAQTLPDENTPIPLSEFLHLMWSDITSSVDTLPAELKLLFVRLAALVAANFPSKEGDGHKEARFMAVTSFLFLRFICPAIISPKPYGINEATNVDIRVSKALKRMARIIQYLANFKESIKEDDEDRADPKTAEDLRNFVRTNVPVMRDLVVKIATPPPQGLRSESRVVDNVDLPREAASVYAEVIRWNQELETHVAKATRDKLTNVLEGVSAKYKEKWPGRSTPYQLNISLADAMMFLK